MSTSEKICTDSCKDSDGVCDVNDMLQNMSTVDKDNDVSVCANCGKEGANVNNTCNKCHQVKYCNSLCKKKHKKKHKKECEEYQRRAAKLHDEKLFKQPPPLDDCPICFLQLPSLQTSYKYMTCCGKRICSGCLHAPRYDDKGNQVDNKKCPFCRVPQPETDEEIHEREKKRVEAGDAHAIYNIGFYYYNGTSGFPQDYTKAVRD